MVILGHMPELPAVEFGRKLVETNAKGKKIKRVYCANDPIVYDEDSPRKVARVLKDRRVNSIKRWGKYIWWELNQKPYPVFHFGMRGAFRSPTQEPLLLLSPNDKTPTSWPPRYIRFHVCFGDGSEVALTDPRRFSRIRLRNDPRNEAPIKKLGFDVFLDPPSDIDFWKRLSGRNVSLKAFLLDQTVLAGVGNWIADEALFHAGLSVHDV